MRQITPPSEWPDDAFERLAGALDQAASAPVGPHFTDQQIQGLIDGTVDDADAQPLWYHMSSCEECAIAVEGRLSKVRAARDRSPKTPRERSPKTPANDQRPMQFQPYYPTDHPPGCVSPLNRAAATEWSEITIRTPKDRPLPEPTFPFARIQGNVCPLVVTTAFRASYEHRRADAWRVVAPLVVAPPVTRIVTTPTTGLASLHDHKLARELRKKCIAVADATSTFAARLVSAAALYNFKTEHVAARPENPDERTLYLTTLDFDDMTSALKKGEIDGFATVEPFPTIAKQLSLRDRYREATLGPSCTSTLTEFCCVLLGPRALVEDSRYERHYKALVRTLYRSFWRVLSDLRLDVPATAESLQHGVDLERFAAAAMLRHIIEALDFDASEEKVEQQFVSLLVPEVTPQSLNHDYWALTGFLSVDEQRQLVETAKDPEAIYSTKRLRELCSEGIRAEIEDASIKEKLRYIGQGIDWDKLTAPLRA